LIVDQWIDIHAHFYPPETEEQREQRLKAMRDANSAATDALRWDPESALAYMNRMGIAMQMLSNVPKSIEALRASNDYAASLVRKYPSRFGLLAALPTDNPEAALAEINRAYSELNADGFAVTCNYNKVYLSDSSLDPVWAELDRRHAVVFAHPDACAAGSMGRPSALIEVAFETASTITDMLYAGTFRKFPDVTFVFAHSGGAFPALSGRLLLLGNENWIPNPDRLTPLAMREHLRRVYLDSAAASSPTTTLGSTVAMTGHDHLLYGSDCGVLSSTDDTMDANIYSLLSYAGLTKEQIEEIGHNALRLFPAAAERISRIPG
jgi:6-methylsalicylate decarboxylase